MRQFATIFDSDFFEFYDDKLKAENGIIRFNRNNMPNIDACSLILWIMTKEDINGFEYENPKWKFGVKLEKNKIIFYFSSKQHDEYKEEKITVNYYIIQESLKSNNFYNLYKEFKNIKHMVMFDELYAHNILRKNLYISESISEKILNKYTKGIIFKRFNNKHYVENWLDAVILSSKIKKFAPEYYSDNNIVCFLFKSKELDYVKKPIKYVSFSLAFAEENIINELKILEVFCSSRWEMYSFKDFIKKWDSVNSDDHYELCKIIRKNIIKHIYNGWPINLI